MKPALKPFPFQEEGVKFLATRQNAFLADQPGLGKTPQAVLAAKMLFSYDTPICVICPRSAVQNWRREFRRWWPDYWKQVFVTNFEKVLDANNDAGRTFHTSHWELIIIDEAHRLKSAGAKRTQAVYRRIWDIRKKTGGPPYVWLLSGTPAKNHTGELWTHIAALRPDLLKDRSGRPMSQEQFEEKYCRVGFDTHGHRRIYGSKNVKHLRKKLFSGGFMLRRMKREVQAELPELIIDEYPLGLGKSPAPGREALFDDVLRKEVSLDQKLEILKENANTLAEWRHAVAEFKIPLVKDYVETELETPGQKIIVFFHHKVLGRELHHLLAEYQPVIVDGQTKDPQAEVDKFQNDPNCRVFLGQIATCQEALNITAATQVAFAEAAWSPSDNYQAACRAHRFGMQENLIVRFLYLVGSTDEIVQRVLARKAVELAELFD